MALSELEIRCRAADIDLPICIRDTETGWNSIHSPRHYTPSVGDEWKPPSVAPLRFANQVIRPLLESPFHSLLSGRLMLLRYTGRKTSRLITLPIGYQIGTKTRFWV
jgi:hypothetical protein